MNLSLNPDLSLDLSLNPSLNLSLGTFKYGVKTIKKLQNIRQLPDLLKSPRLQNSSCPRVWIRVT